MQDTPTPCPANPEDARCKACPAWRQMQEMEAARVAAEERLKWTLDFILLSAAEAQVGPSPLPPARS